MVEFAATLPNFYARDPRNTRTVGATPTNMLYYSAEVPQARIAYTGVSPSGQTRQAQLAQSGVGFPALVPTVTGAVSGPLGITTIPGVTVLDTGRPVREILGSRTKATGRNTVNPLTAVVNGVIASSVNRLINNNLPSGADYALVPVESYQYNGTLDPSEDNRVIITDPTGLFISRSPITAPLAETGGVLFPYTPQITFGHKANYETEPLVHTNYEHMMYRNSTVDNIGISAQFTANNSDEARYVLAVIHFFRAVTKMFYGQDSLAGTPPPVLFLDGFGNLMIDHVPVVVTNFDYQLPQDVDYISIDDSRSNVGALVPTLLNVTIGLKPTYSRNKISNNFGLEKFVNGELITGGRPGEPGPGGFI